MIRNAISALLLVALFSNPVLGDNRAEFVNAYKEYQILVSGEDLAALLQAAKNAWQLSQKAFGEDHPNTASTAVNYAKVIALSGDNRPAIKILKSVLRTQERLFGTESIELIDTLMELGKTSFRQGRVRPHRAYFRRALKLATMSGMPEFTADLSLEIGMFLLEQQEVGAKKYLIDANEIYKQQFGMTDYHTALSASYLGNVAMREGEWNRATQYLSPAIQVFAANRDHVEMELSARRLVVRAYEQLGLSDLATEHCLVIGSKARPDSEGYFPPVYSHRPVYPQSMLNRLTSGHVKLEFVVDEQGFTRDIEVIEATHKEFINAVVDAVKRFRYPPKFEEGEPVSTRGVEQTISFVISD